LLTFSLFLAFMSLIFCVISGKALRGVISPTTQGCFKILSAVNRLVGSTIKRFLIKSLAAQFLNKKNDFKIYKIKSLIYLYQKFDPIEEKENRIVLF